MKTAHELGLVSCHTCHTLDPAHFTHCSLCRARLHSRKPSSIQRCLALLIGASILYIPANMLPIMMTEQFGRMVPSTILGGVVHLWHMGSYPVAIVILIASVLVPLGKIASLYTLCFTVLRGSAMSPRQRATMYRLTELVGKWSMVDVFVVAVLVALIRITGVMVIRPGTAALAFAAVVILTMFAAEAFDPRLIWDKLGPDEPKP